MGKLYSLISALLLTISAAFSAEPISYEYWFDNDYDSRTDGSMTEGSNSLAFDIPSPPQGTHFFNLRLGYDNEKWGTVYRKMVLNLAGSVDAVGFEYWLDNDYAAKTEGDLSVGSNTYNIDLTGVKKGLHRFNYRIRTANGTWGATFVKYFYATSNPNHFSAYEYWFDNDYTNRVSANVTGSHATFDVDLSNFDKSGGAHYFNLRTRDGDGDWSPVYHKLLLFTKDEKRVPMIGYRHYANGVDLGYVEVAREFTDVYMFDVSLPDSMRYKVKDLTPLFDGDKVSFAPTDSLQYIMQPRTELGWGASQLWKLPTSNTFYTTAAEMTVNSRKTFNVPESDKFVAVKFTAGGDSLYFRAEVPISLDIYKDGNKVMTVSATDIAKIASVKLEAGSYFGILRDADATPTSGQFTFHIMDMPNGTPMPEIKYEEGMVSITCSRTDAEIHYTLDGNDPTMESLKYDGNPFQLLHNAVVKARAFVPDSDIEPSAIAEYTIDSYQAATPTGEFDRQSKTLTIKSETENATISYKFNSEEEWLSYEAPIKIRRNGTVYAKASFPNYKDSETAELKVTELPDSVPTPTISFADGMISISTDVDDAEIHYTLGDSVPSISSTLYTAPFALTHNAIVRAIALIADMDIDPSRIAEYKVDSYTVAKPEGKYDFKSRLLTITCTTDKATINYKIGEEGDWTNYESPIRIARNCTVFAKATLKDFNDSPEEQIVISEFPDVMPKPVISFENGMVNISCEREDAEIHYSIDGNTPTKESALYENPFALAHNATVKAMAFIQDCDIDPSFSEDYIVDSYKVATPTGSFDMETRLMTLSCATEGAAISYRVGAVGEGIEYKEPFHIGRNTTIYAKATFEGYNDSDVAEIAVTGFPDSMPTPVISFENGMVSMSCEREDAKIRYTLDKTEPTMESTLYTDPFALTHNATIWAIAYIPDSDIEPSEIAERVVDSYTVAKPVGSYDFQYRTLTITCATEGAAISYRFNENEEWNIYQDPIRIARNCTVYAMATLKDFNDSPVETIVISEFPDAMPRPVVSFNDGKVTISCDRKDAEIHYTTDGTTPTTESTRYTEPFALAYNATVKAMAFIPNSDIEPSYSEDFVVSSYKVATPTGSFNMETRLMTLSCATEGATISYRVGAVGEWIDYKEPFHIGRNTTIYAKATFGGYNDSDVAEIAVTGFPDSMPSPVITFEDGMVSMSCEREDAEIRYTLDKTEPTMESTLYTDPFALTHNATIWAIAYIPDSDIEPSEIAERVVDSYTVAKPVGSYDFQYRSLTITCATEGAAISYRFSENEGWTIYQDPIRIAHNCTVYAMATLKDFNDSPVETIVISDFPDAMPMPEVSFKDGMVTISCDRKDAEIHYTTDGTTPTTESTRYTEPFALAYNATVKAMAFIPNSDIEPSYSEDFVVSSYKVATPTGSFNMETRLMTLSCATEGATISYRVGAVGEWIEYKEPFHIGRNTTVYAKATFGGYNDSDVAEIAVTGFPDSMPSPVISFEDGMVSMSCEREDAEIRYTLDKTEPTMESTLYTDPFALTHNATIWAFAYIPDSDIEPSEIAEMVVDSYKTATPTGTFDMASRTMALSCSTEGAKIFYHIGTSEEWIEYTGPITIGRNCTVYAKATFEGYNDSDIAEIPVTGFPDSMPQPSISFSNGMVKIMCERNDAEIRYTIDGSEPTVASTLYTGEFAVARNLTVKAIAFIPNSDIEPSEVSVFVVDSYKTATPTGAFDMASRTMNLSCATEGAKIFYHIGTSEEWIEYTGPITIRRNCIVYAKATFEGYNDSDIAEIPVTDFPDSMPRPSISFDKGMVTISCEIEDADIYYTIDGTDPTIESTLYTGKFEVARNLTVKAIAYLPNSEIAPSEIASYEVIFFKVDTPTGSFNMEARLMTLSCTIEGAAISYRIGIIGEWTVYNGPFTVGRNTTVYAKATLNGYTDSDVAEIPVTGFPDSMPQPVISFSNGMVTIECERSDAEIRYTLDETVPTKDSTPYTGPFALDHNATIWAIAFIPNSDIEPSEVSQLVVDYYQTAKPEISFNGRFVKLESDDADAEIRYSMDGSDPSNGEKYTSQFDAEGLCTVRAIAIKEGYKDSEISEYQVEGYADEHHAEISKGGLLKTCFEWSDSELLNTLDEFRVEGVLNNDDYAFLNSLSSLRHLDIEDVRQASIPDNAFRNSGLVSISMPADLILYGDSILSGCSRLCGVIWNSSAIDIEARLTDGLANPNVLLYVLSDISVANADRFNIVVDGEASSIILHDGCPFDVAREFKATEISFTRNFTKKTVAGQCGGWETLILPFSPEQISHEKHGDIVSFAAWDGDYNGDKKPFWLYESTADDWKLADQIRPYVPYIISMPNDSNYVEEFRLAGNVTFTANNVSLSPDSEDLYVADWKNDTKFVGTFMPVEGPAIRSLNQDETSDRLPGSTFVENVKTQPFSAYVTGTSRKAIPVFGDWSGMTMLTVHNDGLKVESPAPGMLRITSDSKRKVEVMTVTGVVIRSQILMGGETITIEGLTRDLYIVGGKKVMVK